MSSKAVLPSKMQLFKNNFAKVIITYIPPPFLTGLTAATLLDMVQLVKVTDPPSIQNPPPLI